MTLVIERHRSPNDFLPLWWVASRQVSLCWVSLCWESRRHNVCMHCMDFSLLKDIRGLTNAATQNSPTTFLDLLLSLFLFPSLPSLFDLSLSRCCAYTQAPLVQCYKTFHITYTLCHFEELYFTTLVLSLQVGGASA